MGEPPVGYLHRQAAATVAGATDALPCGALDHHDSLLRGAMMLEQLDDGICAAVLMMTVSGVMPGQMAKRAWLGAVATQNRLCCGAIKL